MKKPTVEDFAKRGIEFDVKEDPRGTFVLTFSHDPDNIEAVMFMTRLRIMRDMLELQKVLHDFKEEKKNEC